MDRGAWRAIVHGVTKSQTQLSFELLSGSPREHPGVCLPPEATFGRVWMRFWLLQHVGRGATGIKLARTRVAA